MLYATSGSSLIRLCLTTLENIAGTLAENGYSCGQQIPLYGVLTLDKIRVNISILTFLSGILELRSGHCLLETPTLTAQGVHPVWVNRPTDDADHPLPIPVPP